MTENINNTNITVSVIIPAYNIEEYINRAIDSVLAQTRPPEEIIVVNDGSTDNTGEIINEYGSKVKYIYQENRGLSGARNTGIRAAISNWVAFLDGDDEWLPEKLRAQIEQLKRYPELVWADTNIFAHNCSTNTRTVCNIPEYVNKYLGDMEYFDSYFTAANGNVVLIPSTMIVRRDIFSDVGLFNEKLRYAEDLDMWWRITFQWPKLGYINEPLAVYYQHRPGSLTVDTEHENIVSILSDIFEQHLKPAQQAGCLQEAKQFITLKLKKWLYTLYCQKQYEFVRETVTRFEDVLPGRYVKVMKLLTRLPVATKPVGKRVLKIMGYVK